MRAPYSGSDHRGSLRVVVLVVDVGRVLVIVLDRLVLVRMGMLARHRRIVHVSVMPVVVPMHVIVPERRVSMAMRVMLGRVEVHAGPEQQRGREGPPARGAITERVRERGADEGREREHRPRAAGADATLREQVQAQAQAVAGRAARDERERGRRAR